MAFLPLAPAMIYLLIWFKYKVATTRKQSCPYCNVGVLELLDKRDCTRSVDRGTSTEIALGSADIYAYKCSVCRKTKIEKVYLSLPNVDICPNCGYHTLVMQSPFKVEHVALPDKADVKVALFSCKECRKSYKVCETFKSSLKE